MCSKNGFQPAVLNTVGGAGKTAVTKQAKPPSPHRAYILKTFYEIKERGSLALILQALTIYVERLRIGTELKFQNDAKTRGY